MCKNWKVELREPAAFKPEPRVGGSWCFSSQLEVRALRVGSGRAGAQPKWSCQGDGTFWPPSKWVQGMTRDPVTTARILYLVGCLVVDIFNVLSSRKILKTNTIFRYSKLLIITETNQPLYSQFSGKLALYAINFWPRISWKILFAANNLASGGGGGVLIIWG